MNEALAEAWVQGEKDRSCYRPVKLSSGHIKRCGSQRYQQCPPCSTRHMRETQVMLWSGIPQEQEDREKYRWIFYTLTAPSCGLTVHNRPRQNNRPCSACGEHHSDDYGDIGVPVEITTDYAYSVDDDRFRQLVRFNQKQPTLLNNTMDRIQRQYPELAWVSAQEWQTRLAIHSHLLIRVPEWCPLNEVFAYLKGMANGGVRSEDAQWGYVDVQLVGGDLASNTRYLSKAITYAHKEVQADRLGVDEKSAARALYEQALGEAAKGLVCKRAGCNGDGVCKGKAHWQFGFTGIKLRKSRGWSLNGSDMTRKRLQQERVEWAINNQTEQEQDANDVRMRMIYAHNKGVSLDVLYEQKMNEMFGSRNAEH